MEIKVYVTKFALTKGIFETIADVSENYPNLASASAHNFRDIYHKPFWHTTREEAVAQAEKMRIAKIKSVEKQLKKLQNMKF